MENKVGYSMPGDREVTLLVTQQPGRLTTSPTRKYIYTLWSRISFRRIHSYMSTNVDMENYGVGCISTYSSRQGPYQFS
jgi:hypothetical protein